jgi:hypothetical protein
MRRDRPHPRTSVCAHVASPLTCGGMLSNARSQLRGFARVFAIDSAGSLNSKAAPQACVQPDLPPHPVRRNSKMDESEPIDS